MNQGFKLHVQYRPEGLQHFTRVMRMYYMHIIRTVHANALNACNFYTQYLRVKLHAVAKMVRIVYSAKTKLFADLGIFIRALRDKTKKAAANS